MPCYLPKRLIVFVLIFARAAFGQSTDQADLSIAASGPLYATFGDRVPYTLTITNLGPSVASGVVVSVSAAFQVSSTGVCGSGFPCAIGSLASNQSLVVPAFVQTPYLFCPECNDPLGLYFLANVTSETQDSAQSNNHAAVSTILSPVRTLRSVPAINSWSGIALIVLLVLGAFYRRKHSLPGAELFVQANRCDRLRYYHAAVSSGRLTQALAL